MFWWLGNGWLIDLKVLCFMIIGFVMVIFLKCCRLVGKCYGIWLFWFIIWLFVIVVIIEIFILNFNIFFLLIKKECMVFF